MAILLNQGTLRYTPQGGAQGVAVSNTTSTVFEVNYGLSVSHGASPETYGNGDSIRYSVVMTNTGSGTLYAPTIRVDLAGGALDYVENSATAFLYSGTDVQELPFSVTSDEGGLLFSFDGVLSANESIFLLYEATVSDMTCGLSDSIVSTATGTAREGSEEGQEISDSDTAVITCVPLSIVKSAPATATVGETIRYVFTVTNQLGAPIVLDQLTDQLPANFQFTGITLSIAGVPIPLVATDYFVTPDGFLTLDPASIITLPAGAQAIVTITGVVTV